MIQNFLNASKSRFKEIKFPFFLVKLNKVLLQEFFHCVSVVILQIQWFQLFYKHFNVFFST